MLENLERGITDFTRCYRTVNTGILKNKIRINDVEKAILMLKKDKCNS